MRFINALVCLALVSISACTLSGCPLPLPNGKVARLIPEYFPLKPDLAGKAKWRFSMYSVKSNNTFAQPVFPLVTDEQTTIGSANSANARSNIYAVIWSYDGDVLPGEPDWRGVRAWRFSEYKLGELLSDEDKKKAEEVFSDDPIIVGDRCQKPTRVSLGKAIDIDCVDPEAVLTAADALKKYYKFTFYFVVLGEELDKNGEPLLDPVRDEDKFKKSNAVLYRVSASDYLNNKLPSDYYTKLSDRCIECGEAPLPGCEDTPPQDPNGTNVVTFKLPLFERWERISMAFDESAETEGEGDGGAAGGELAPFRGYFERNSGLWWRYTPGTVAALIKDPYYLNFDSLATNLLGELNNPERVGVGNWRGEPIPVISTNETADDTTNVTAKKVFGAPRRPKLGVRSDFSSSGNFNFEKEGAWNLFTEEEGPSLFQVSLDPESPVFGLAGSSTAYLFAEQFENLSESAVSRGSLSINFDGQPGIVDVCDRLQEEDTLPAEQTLPYERGADANSGTRTVIIRDRTIIGSGFVVLQQKWEMGDCAPPQVFQFAEGSNVAVPYPIGGAGCPEDGEFNGGFSYTYPAIVDASCPKDSGSEKADCECTNTLLDGLYSPSLALEVTSLADTTIYPLVGDWLLLNSNIVGDKGISVDCGNNGCGVQTLARWKDVQAANPTLTLKDLQELVEKSFIEVTQLPDPKFSTSFDGKPASARLKDFEVSFAELADPRNGGRYPITSWAWTVKSRSNGESVHSSSERQLPPKKFAEDGEYDVTLTVKSDVTEHPVGVNNGVSETRKIEVTERPIASFKVEDRATPTLRNREKDEGRSVALQDTSSAENEHLKPSNTTDPEKTRYPILGWEWTFSGPKLSNVKKTDQNQDFAFPDDGDYTVQLKVSSEPGEDTKSETIEVTENPEALFSVEKLSTAAERNRETEPGRLVQFTDESNAHNENLGNRYPITSWLWTFYGGDGKPVDSLTSTEASPNIAFPDDGCYGVSLEVQNQPGSDKVELGKLIVTENPEAKFSINPRDTIENQLTNKPVYFQNESLAHNENSCEGGFPITEVTWDFGDGKPFSHEQNPVHYYEAAGEYRPTLTVVSATGSDTYQLPDPIRVVAVPTAAFSIPDRDTADQRLVSNQVKFENQSRSNNDGLPAEFSNLSYHWEFPGGSPASSDKENPDPVTYPAQGCYPVTLTVTNAVTDAVGPQRTTVDVEVTEKPVVTIQMNERPDADDRLAKYPVNFTSTVIENNNETCHPGVTTYLWNFDDGDTSQPNNAPNLQHKFKDPRCYKVTLTVTTLNSGSDSDSALVVKSTELEVEVTELPKAGFTANGVIPTQSQPLTGKAPFTVNFVGTTDEQTFCSAYSPELEWDFGNGPGSHSLLRQPAPFTYTTPGTYTVTLTAKTEAGEDVLVATKCIKVTP